MDILSVLKLFGGIGLFLFGIKTMGAALKELAGSSLSAVLEKLTTAKSKAVGVLKGWSLGVGVTAIIQSSAAVTVMIIGFVNASLMEVFQAVPVVFGSNVGSTVTAQILRLGDLGSGNIFLQLLKPSSFGCILTGLGAFILLFAKKKRTRDVSELLIGLGVLFLGMTMMEEVFTPLREDPAFQRFFISFENPFLGILIGIVLTAIIQSSSASVGILQALSATGAITYSVAIPVLIGMNVGKCVTTTLGSLGASRKAKRVSLSYLLFNVFGAVIFTAVIYTLQYTVGLSFFEHTVNRGNIADMHLIFNLGTSILILPFTMKVCALTEKILPDSAPSEEDLEFAKLDDMLLNTPRVALQQCRYLMQRMSQKVVENYGIATGLIYKYDEDQLEVLQKNEEFLDRCETVLSSYIVRIDKRRLTRDGNLEVTEILNSIGDFERMGDYCINISFAARDKKDQKVNFSDAGQLELDTIIQATAYCTESVNSAFTRTDAALARRVQPLSDVIGNMKDVIKAHHVERLQEGICSVESGMVLTDLVNSFERIASHGANVALHILKRASADQNFDEMHGHTDDVSSEEYKALYTYYESRYLLPVSETTAPLPVNPVPESHKPEGHTEKDKDSGKDHKSGKDKGKKKEAEKDHKDKNEKEEKHEKSEKDSKEKDKKKKH